MKPLERVTVEREIDALLASCPELADDENLRHDMVSGSTGAFELLDKIVKRYGECGASIDGLDKYLTQLVARCDRLERRRDGLRSLMHRIMECAALSKAQLDSATLSISAGRPRVIVTQDESIPDDYCRMKREPNKAAIKAALEAGDHVPGAVLSNAEPVLMVRVK